MANQRGLVQRIERMLEDGVGDVFARVFGGSIVPQEVEALLRREASDGVQALADESYLAPNDYVITLSPQDYERFSADRDFTSTAFARHLDGYLQEQGWQTYGTVVVRFEQSDTLHTGQYRARAVVNPDADPRPSPPPAAKGQSTHAYPAEPGAAAMTDNPTYRGGPDSPGDDFFDEQYDAPQVPQDQGYPPRQYDQGGYPEQGYDQGFGQGAGAGYGPGAGPGYGPAAGQGYGQGYSQPGQQGWQNYGPGPQGYDQRPPAGGYAPPPQGYDQGYDQGYRPGPGGYPPQGGQPYGPPPGGGYAPPPADYDYGRPAPGRYDEPGYGRHEQRPPYPEQPGYQQGYGGYGQQEYGQPNYAQPDYSQPAAGGFGGGWAPPAPPAPAAPAAPATPEFDYGLPAGQPAGGFGGYAPPVGQGEYPASGRAVTLQLDDGSGRTYQLREGANVVGRGQEAQFRLPDTGVSRRHLEIRWDGQVALLSDLNSTNGTTVNNAPVQEWQLADGDVIRLGHSEIIVHVR